MIRKLAAGIAGATLILGASAGIASAKSGDVVKPGTCSGRSDAKIKVGPRVNDNVTQVEFSVDESRPARTWTVRIKDNGATIVNRTARTNARGEFEVQKASRRTRPPVRGHRSQHGDGRDLHRHRQRLTNPNPPWGGITRGARAFRVMPRVSSGVFPRRPRRGGRSCRSSAGIQRRGGDRCRE